MNTAEFWSSALYFQPISNTSRPIPTTTFTMDYERFRQERITSTKIQPYHMITAVTQRAINKQLSMMHKVNPTLRNLSLKSTDPEDDYSGLEAELDPPTIELRLGTESEPLSIDVFIGC